MTAVARALLWDGFEDYTGLWEALAEVMAQRPDLSVPDARAHTAELLQDFLQRDWIAIFYCQEPLSIGLLVDVPELEHASVLARGPYWKPPTKGSRSVRFATTELGKAAYDAAGELA